MDPAHNKQNAMQALFSKYLVEIFAKGEYSSTAVVQGFETRQELKAGWNELVAQHKELAKQRKGEEIIFKVKEDGYTKLRTSEPQEI